MKSKEKPRLKTGAYFLYVTGGKIYVDAAIRRLVLVVEACDAGKNLTFKELQGRAATR